MAAHRRNATLSLIAVVWMLLAAIVLVACGGPTSGGTPPPDGGGGDGGGGSGQVATREQLKAVAAAVYGDLADGQDAAGNDVSSLFGVFGIATVPASDGAAFDAAVASGDPFLLDFEADAIARSLNEGLLVSVSSFLSSLADKGVTDANGAALDEAALDAKLKPLLDLDSYDATQLLPALVLWLGKERAEQESLSDPDPVWGDGMLDPLQFNLLLMGINLASQETGTDALQPATLHSASLHPTTLQPPLIQPQGLSSLLPTLSKFAPKAKTFTIRSLVAGWIASHIHFPLGPIGSTQAAICTSILLYSYKVDVNVDPDEVYAREYDHPARAYQSHITATLSFDFHQDVDSFPKQVSLWLAGCDLPPTGISSGKTVTWALHDQLPDLGKLEDQTMTTDAVGKATAAYTTFDEVVPEELRFSHTLQAATGAVTVEAHGLAPKKWENLVAVIRVGKPDLGTGTGFLTVFRYALPHLVLSLDTNISEPDPDGGDIWRGILSATVPLSLVDAGTPTAHYEGEATLHYDSFAFTALPPCTVSTSTTDGRLHVQTSPLSDSDGALELTVSFTPAPTDPGHITCPPTGGGPISGDTWQGAWIVLHENELTTAGGTAAYAIEDWTAGDIQTSKSYDRTYVDDEGVTLLTEKTSLVLTPAE